MCVQLSAAHPTPLLPLGPEITPLPTPFPVRSGTSPLVASFKVIDLAYKLAVAVFVGVMTGLGARARPLELGCRQQRRGARRVWGGA